jgi:hypothetical protein
MNDKLVAPITKDELMLVAQIIAWDKAPSRDRLYRKAPQIKSLIAFILKTRGVKLSISLETYNLA